MTSLQEDLRHGRFMRREGSMAVHTLFHLHRTVRSDFSSVPLYFIKYKSSFYLAVTLLETAVKVTHAGAADKTSLQALRPSQHPRGACCSQILSPSCNHQTSQVLAEVSKHCINKQREKKKSIWLTQIMRLARHCQCSALFCVCVF